MRESFVSEPIQPVFPVAGEDRIRTATGQEMKIYFERQARSKGSARQRWWIFSIVNPE